MGFPSTACFTAARELSDRTVPVGLWGELRIMALVLGVMTRDKASGVIWKSVSFRFRATGVPPATVVMVSYREKAGVGIITSSPGFKMPKSAVNRAPVAPAVISTCSAVQSIPRPLS